MPRLSRSKTPTQYWHAMARGVRKAPIFLTDGQKDEFMGRVARAVEKYEVKMLGFTLMDNHLHNEVIADGKELGAFMQYITGLHARDLNRLTQQTGHAFQGRFLAYPSGSPYWAARVATYIHLNSVAAGLVDHPLEYRWSSCADYCGGKNGFIPIHTAPVLQQFGDPENGARRYQEHMDRVAARIRRDCPVLEGILRSNSPVASNGGPSLEEARFQVFAAQEILALARGSHNGESRTSWSRELAVRLAHRTRLAHPRVLAAVLGCSVRSVFRLRAQADLLASQSTEFRHAEQECLSGLALAL